MDARWIQPMVYEFVLGGNYKSLSQNLQENGAAKTLELTIQRSHAHQHPICLPNRTGACVGGTAWRRCRARRSALTILRDQERRKLRVFPNEA